MASYTAAAILYTSLTVTGANYGGTATDHEYKVIDSPAAMAVCRRMEAAFHKGSPTLVGDVRYSSNPAAKNYTEHRESACFPLQP